MKKIFVFSAVPEGEGGLAIAFAEDGFVLGSHWCSDEHFALHDLGVTEGARPDRHEIYKNHFPDGYEMVFVRAADVKTNQELQKAMAISHRRRSTQDMLPNDADFEISAEELL